jgi:hypothetical protein
LIFLLLSDQRTAVSITKQAITHFLKPVEENGSLRIVTNAPPLREIVFSCHICPGQNSIGRALPWTPIQPTDADPSRRGRLARYHLQQSVDAPGRRHARSCRAAEPHAAAASAGAVAGGCSPPSASAAARAAPQVAPAPSHCPAAADAAAAAAAADLPAGFAGLRVGGAPQPDSGLRIAAACECANGAGAGRGPTAGRAGGKRRTGRRIQVGSAICGGTPQLDSAAREGGRDRDRLPGRVRFAANSKPSSSRFAWRLRFVRGRAH